jgi:hypothetical protein
MVGRVDRVDPQRDGPDDWREDSAMTAAAMKAPTT